MTEKNVFLIGIGGAGMSALARYFLSKNFNVYGYDRELTEVSESLIGLGANIETDVQKTLDLFDSLTFEKIVRTPAVKEDNPLMIGLFERGLKIIKRSDELGNISRNHICLGVAGTHGKTTISSMLAKILAHEGKSMIAFLGGDCKDFESNYYEIAGQDQRMLVEADEYDRTFLKLHPHSAIISNLDADHLDIYGDEEGVFEGFNAFAGLVKGNLLVHVDHAENIYKECFTYGKNGDFSYKLDGNLLSFEFKGGSYSFNSPFLGIYNIENALGAFGLAVLEGVKPEIAIEALMNFKGVKRRAEFIIRRDDLVFIDDYAHHPSEIKVLRDAIEKQYHGKKVLGVFQPHLFSRTQDFVDDFRMELSRWENLLLLDIYPAREEAIPGVTSEWLSEGIESNIELASLDNVFSKVKEKDFDVLVLFGAGSIGTKVKEIKSFLE